MPIPIVDLFAGPGGLGEGFSSVNLGEDSAFKVRLSVEKDPVAHRTLSLRAAFRYLKETGNTDAYYDYITGRIDRAEFLGMELPQKAMLHALSEAKCAELGKVESTEIDKWIRNAIGTSKDKWVLIGGPPCQAYSLAGRSRRTNDVKFQHDEKHFLYGFYLRMIRVHAPPIFVMENVKGILSSTHRGSPIFSKIEKDLSHPCPGLNYEIRSFAVQANGSPLRPQDYVIRSEEYGIPQARHRVILLGVRSDLGAKNHQLLVKVAGVSVQDAIDDMPRLRSGVSPRAESLNWLRIVENTRLLMTEWENEHREVTLQILDDVAEMMDYDGLEARQPVTSRSKSALALRKWIRDPNLEEVIQHQARSHMASDLQRYFFASCFAIASGQSPRIRDFPQLLLPSHKNVVELKVGEVPPFQDRFRVQVATEPSTTVVAHIAKDGHYYIHYDPTQCRSLTVREAARIQTFPDNYFFEGNRTQQYMQVGNAVPPFLAKQLGEVVLGLLR